MGVRDFASDRAHVSSSRRRTSPPDLPVTAPLMVGGVHGGVKQKEYEKYLPCNTVLRSPMVWVRPSMTEIEFAPPSATMCHRFS